MGTMQQELGKLSTLNNLTFDDPDEGTQPVITMEQPTLMPRRQQVWQYIHDNPSVTAAEVADAIGIERAECASTVYLLFQNNLLSRNKHGGYYCYSASVDAYPIYTKEQRLAALQKGWEAAAARRGQPRGPRAKKAAAKAKRPYAKRKQAAAKQVETTIEQRKAQLLAPGVTNAFVDSTQSFINQLTVHQAKAVYDELKKIFGG